MHLVQYGCCAEINKPFSILGYPVGTQYSRHHRVVDYFRSVATAVPEMVKLEKYGETEEGRDLIMAIIASPENLQNIESIRLNNVRLAGIHPTAESALTKDPSHQSHPPSYSATDSSHSISNPPAIVWLSYNVHGDEASSSEAAMLTLFSLVDPNNLETKAWLKNLVIIIDPCINPDGRDRYVNWFNSVVGKNANPDPWSREHMEPWPGGRSNHYYFDLNRDWAWQTQTESVLRMKNTMSGFRKYM